MDLVAFFTEVLKLVPLLPVAVPAVALGVDLLKRIKIVPDGKAGLASLILNALFWFGLVAARQAGVEKEATDLIVAIGAVGPVVISLVLSLLGAKWFHDDIAKTVGLAFSHPKPLGAPAG